MSGSHAPTKSPATKLQAKSALPTRHAMFQFHVFSNEEGAALPSHIAMALGDLQGAENLPVRVHSECMTSEVFGSLKCDCKEQLDAALHFCGTEQKGLVIYLRQEGRGIGLVDKIRAYALQAEGHDTVDANRMLGLSDDTRDYTAARDILNHFGVRSIRLLTNNPAKVAALTDLGVKVRARVPIVVEPTAYSQSYLETKRVRMDHMLPVQSGSSATPPKT